MKDTVLITCFNKPFDEKLAAAFVQRGFRVYAMGSKHAQGVTLLPCAADEASCALREKEGKLDFLLDTTDTDEEQDNFTVRCGINPQVMERVFRQNVLRSMSLLEAFLPLLDEGEGKRLFYLTSAKSSINETRRIDHFGYNMSKTALHQFIQMTRNKLFDKGYTFRVFDPVYDEAAPEDAAQSAFNYITRRRGTENNDPKRDDEDNLVFRDAFGRQHCW
ncbi:MAG: hypothetical protein FWC03_00940 [Treponema sp.]|nr:hypothetical protein [Treponema sp.]